MRIGAHVRDDDPVGAAAEREAAVVQFFLADPQGWTAPRPHPQAEQLRTSDLEVYLHAPYVVKVAAGDNALGRRFDALARLWDAIAAQQLVAVCAAANAPVVLETRDDSQAKDIAWLREQLDS